MSEDELKLLALALEIVKSFPLDDPLAKVARTLLYGALWKDSKDGACPTCNHMSTSLIAFYGGQKPLDVGDGQRSDTPYFNEVCEDIARGMYAAGIKDAVNQSVRNDGGE
jgi:hypothetical protein